MRSARGRSTAGRDANGGGAPRAVVEADVDRESSESTHSEEKANEKASPQVASPFKQSIEKVRALIEPIAVAHRVEIVELSWVTERVGRTLRLTIERSGVGPTLEDQLLVGFGVSLEDCALVSRDVSAALDAADLIPHAYFLEVSSPGLDRPLRHVADFVRFTGQTAKVKLRHPASDGQRVLRGRIRSVSGYDSTETAGTARISIEVDRKVIEIPYSAVESANLVYELAAQPKASPKVASSKTSSRSDKLNPHKLTRDRPNPTKVNPTRPRPEAGRPDRPRPEKGPRAKSKGPRR